MFKRFLFALVFLVLSLESADFPPLQKLNESDIKKIILFLTEPGNIQGNGQLGQIGTKCGMSYTATNRHFPDHSLLPLSFYSSPEYWQYYVGQNSHEILDVVDIYNEPKGYYNLSPIASSETYPFPTLLSPGNLQIERINAFNGSNIYDGAVWQITLALAGQAGIKGPENQSLFAIAQAQTTLLYLGTYGGNYGQETSYGLGTLRASSKFTDQPFFTYGYQHQFVQGDPLINKANAFMFRMIPPNFINPDPITFISQTQFISSQPDPLPSPYYKGSVTWQDFKPILGENAWALLLGPLHLELIKQKSLNTSYVPFSCEAVKIAIYALPTFQAMQSPIGALYYTVHGALGNIGEVNPYFVALENNISALGGLLSLNKILIDELTYDPDLSLDDKKKILASLSLIKTMIYGGVSNGVHTKGLLSFLKNQGWDHSAGIFYAGGLSNDPSQESEWVPTNDPKAVDVQTWGLACLGQPLVDEWFGFGTAFAIWEKTKEFGGFYGPDGTLWGVGYSDKDGNGHPNSYEEGIISGEWTCGAINLVRVLMTQYGKVYEENSSYSLEEQNLARTYVERLMEDEKTMSKGVLTLSTDNYPLTPAYEKFIPYATSPEKLSYNQLLFKSETSPQDRLAFVYASKRYAIPFGWNSNPIPSLASTGWMVFNYYNYNPFDPNGSYDPQIE